MQYYLAAAAANVAQDNITAATNVANSWNTAWQTFFTSGLYQAVNNACLGIALLFFIITVVGIIAKAINKNDEQFILKLLVPILICMFLINGGALTVVAIQGIRGVSNGLNNTILTNLQTNQNINARMQNVRGSQAAIKRIQDQALVCKSQATQEAATACATQLSTLISTEQAAGNITDSATLNSMTAYATAVANAAASGNPLAALNASLVPLEQQINSAVLDTVMSGVFWVLQAMTSALQHIVEASFMMTSLTAPLFITAGLLPNGMRSIVALFTAFWSIILYKTCYIILVGLSAQIILDSTSDAAITLSICTAIFAPILAGILAAGGGMGFAKAAASAAAQVTQSATIVAAKFMSGGVL
jgi:hypothetical protein